MTEITNTLNVTRIETSINNSGYVDVTLFNQNPIVNIVGNVSIGVPGDVQDLIPFVNVKEFGADPANTDNTASIQAAIDYVGHGGTLFFPDNKEYVCAGNLYINRFNVRFLGVSNGNNGMQTNGSLRSSAIRFTSTTGDNILINTPGFNIKQIMFENMMFKSVTSGSVLSFDNVSWISIRNVIVNHATNSAQPAIKFDKCFLINVIDSFVIKSANDRASGSTGIKVTLSSGTLAGLYNFYNTSVLEYDTGFSFGDDDQATTTRYRNINLIGCQAKSNNRGMLIQAGVENVNISGCYLEGNLISAIDVWKGASNVEIRDSYFNNPTASNADIRIGRSPTIAGDDYARNVTVSHCSFDNVNTRGVYVYLNDSFSKNIKIEKCTFKETTGGTSAVGIRVSGGARSTEIEDCIFDTITTKIQADVDTLLKIGNTDNNHQLTNVQQISGLRQLLSDEACVHDFEPLTTDRIVRLPDPTTSVGKEYLLSCSASSLKDVVINNHSGTVEYLRLKPGQSAHCWNDGVSNHVHLFNIDNNYFYSNIETITGARILTDSDRRIQILKTTTANYAVRLPVPASSKTKEFIITCTTDSTKNLIIRSNDNLTTYSTLEPGESAHCWNDGINNYVRKYRSGDSASINYSTAAPTSGSWNVSDIFINSAPSAGGYVGWICITSGTPGTWKEFGQISA